MNFRFITQESPCFSCGECQLVGSGDEPVKIQLWAPGSVKLFSLADVKTISFKGKVLYEDTTL